MLLVEKIVTDKITATFVDFEQTQSAGILHKRNCLDTRTENFY
jgi:hypothetical protein